MSTQVLHRNFNAVYRLVYHLVLVSKCRRKVFNAATLERCKAILIDLCVAWDGSLLECSGEADHVHALLDMPPRVRPSDLINNLKTVTSRRLRAEFPALRAAYRGKAVLWSPSYCIISAGGAPIEILRQYVENQKRPE
jgi:putative transposase